MHVAAVDLGASSGRVILAEVTNDRLDLHELHRFPNRPRTVDGHLRWDVAALRAGIEEGLRRAAAATPDLAGVGVDSWAVDYGLLDGDGRLLADPVCYRDERTDGALERIHRMVPAEELYAVTGIQELPINTLPQLVCDDALEHARQLLLIPDLFCHWLTGRRVAERTNASTTQVLDARTGRWATGLLERLDLPAGLLPPVVEPGTVLGPVLPDLADRLALPQATRVVAVGSHDTASAVVGVPMAGPAAAYISSGTWSLVGLELDAPVLSEASRAANFTNEAGVDGTVRYLRNVMGLWLLQESLRTWQAEPELARLLAAAADLPALARVIDPDHPSLLAPGDIPDRIAALSRASGKSPPGSRAETVRTILDSLAMAYRRTVRDAARLAGRDVDVVHVVGGGARNALLCQLTADACGVPVLAGPVEAAAIGNAVVQARTLGALSGGLRELRALVERTQQVVTYRPAGTEEAWARAERLLP